MYAQIPFYNIRYKCALTTQNVSLSTSSAHYKSGGGSCV